MPATLTRKTDVLHEDYSSIHMLTPLTAAARAWVQKNVPTEPWQWQGASLAVEHGYIQDILDGMEAAGLQVK
jgi:hypothetical protein